jgi:hypothetical protein
MRNCLNRKGLSETIITEYTDEINEELLEKKVKKVFNAGGYRFYECPLTAINEETYDLMNMFFLTDNHKQLYFDGNINKQPAFYIELLNIGIAELNRGKNGD